MSGYKGVECQDIEKDDNNDNFNKFLLEKSCYEEVIKELDNAYYKVNLFCNLCKLNKNCNDFDKKNCLINSIKNDILKLLKNYRK